MPFILEIMAGELGQSPHQEMDVIEIGPASTQSVEQQMQAKLAAAKLNCQICGKFSTFSFRTFQSHIRRHQQANEIGPESIHRKLVRSGRVRRKYSVSSRAKRFRLHLTNMSLNAQLNNVQTTSTRSMALVCPHCKFTADKFSNLSIHVKRKHTNLVQTQVFLCTKCHFSAPSRRALQSHLLQMNHYERQCQICNEVFEGNPQYLDHLSLHFSGISVSPVKEQTSEQSSGFNSAAHVSSLHDALKEAALLETEVASNSHFSSRGKSRSLPLVEDVQRPVFSKSVIAKLCGTNGTTSSKSFSDGKPTDDREVTMETQACASAAVEMEMCIDSVACNAETQTENEKPAGNYFQRQCSREFPQSHVFNSRTAIAGAIIGLLLVFYNSKNFNCIGALSFF